MRFSHFLTLGFAGLGLLSLASCASSSRNKDIAYVEQPVEKLYSNALEEIDRRKWERAAKRFDEVERQHPYTVWARRSMLMAAFSYYQANQYPEAISAAEQFIALYPGNASTPYAYYLIAICYYEQIVDVGRDQATTRRAMSALEQVVNRYPNTDYAKDARFKIDMTRDHLAGKDMEVGRWYLRQKYYLAAINRFRRVVDEYQTTTHTPEALYRLVAAYLALGVVGEARENAAVLGYNYPGSWWYEKTYNLFKEHGLLDQVSDLPGTGEQLKKES